MHGVGPLTVQYVVVIGAVVHVIDTEWAVTAVTLQLSPGKSAVSALQAGRTFAASGTTERDAWSTLATAPLPSGATAANTPTTTTAPIRRQ
jgi:hypothetical protein